LILVKVIKSISSIEFTKRRVLALTIFIIAILLLDLSVLKLYGSGLNLYLFSADQKLLIFIILIIGGIAGQFFIIQYVESKTTINKTRSVSYFPNLKKMFNLFQYSIVALLIFTISEILIEHQYRTQLLIAITSISYLVMIVMLGTLSFRFFTWYKSHRSYIGITYALTSASFVVNAIISILYVDTLLLARPMTIGAFGGGSGYPVSLAQILYSGFVISTIFSFILTWLATAFLLHHYSYKLGSWKYWTLVSLPLIYFLSQFLTLVPNLLDPFLQQDPVNFSIFLILIFTLSLAAGGIFFGLAFWLISKNLPQSSIVKEYMIICGLGFIFFFIANQSVGIVIVPYPPFGIIATTYIGLSSYLILVGIYSSALTTSHDIMLRDSIRKLAKSETKLLDSIGRAQNEKEIQGKVIKMVRKHKEVILDQTGVLSTLTDNDMKNYLSEVLKELKNSKRNR
jgi:hypothetical protein